MLSLAAESFPAVVLRPDPGGLCFGNEIDLLVPDGKAVRFAKNVMSQARGDVLTLALNLHPLSSKILIINRKRLVDGFVILDIRSPILKNKRVLFRFADIKKYVIRIDGVPVLTPQLEGRLLLARNRVDQRDPDSKHEEILLRAFPHFSKEMVAEELANAAAGKSSLRIDDPVFLRKYTRVVWGWRLANYLFISRVLRLFAGHVAVSRLSIHGPDGIGKSTLAQCLSEFLESRGVPAPWFHYFEDRSNSDSGSLASLGTKEGPATQFRDSRVQERGPVLSHLGLIKFLAKKLPALLIKAPESVEIHDRHIFDYVDITLRRGQHWPDLTSRVLAKIQKLVTIPIVLSGSTQFILRRTNENSPATIARLVKHQSRLLQEAAPRPSPLERPLWSEYPEGQVNAELNAELLLGLILEVWSKAQRARLKVGR